MHTQIISFYEWCQHPSNLVTAEICRKALNKSARQFRLFSPNQHYLTLFFQILKDILNYKNVTINKLNDLIIEFNRKQPLTRFISYYLRHSSNFQ
jgi:hypothetical protein